MNNIGCIFPVHKILPFFQPAAPPRLAAVLPTGGWEGWVRFANTTACGNFRNGCSLVIVLPTCRLPWWWPGVWIGLVDFSWNSSCLLATGYRRNYPHSDDRCADCLRWSTVSQSVYSNANEWRWHLMGRPTETASRRENRTEIKRSVSLIADSTF